MQDIKKSQDVLASWDDDQIANMLNKLTPMIPSDEYFFQMDLLRKFFIRETAKKIDGNNESLTPEQLAGYGRGRLSKTHPHMVQVFDLNKTEMLYVAIVIYYQFCVDYK